MAGASNSVSVLSPSDEEFGDCDDSLRQFGRLRAQPRGPSSNLSLRGVFGEIRIRDARS